MATDLLLFPDFLLHLLTPLQPYSTQREYYELGRSKIRRIYLENCNFGEFFSLIGRDSRHRFSAFAPGIGRNSRSGA